MLLQVLDDGQLTDGKGRTVDFTHTIIVLTSNLGAENLLRAQAAAPAGAALPAAARDAALAAVRLHFRPEVLNRLDDIVVFEPLSADALRRIVHALVTNLGARLAARDITLAVNAAAVDFIVRTAAIPGAGARPLRRFVEQRLGTELSRSIIAGQLTEHAAVTITVRDGHLDLQVQPQV